jgi:predicted Zn finger-like uncharacterized protein
MAESTYTRCPGCATVFRVTAAQLALREGQVRCGHCRAVFDANDHVVSMDAGVAGHEPGADDELARGRPTVTLRSERALLAVPAPPTDDAAAALARDDIVDGQPATGTGSAGSDSGDATAETGEAEHRRMDDDGGRPEPEPGDARPGGSLGSTSVADDTLPPAAAEETVREGVAVEQATAEGTTAEGTTAEGSTAEGSTAEGSTAEGSTAEGSTAEGSTAEGSTAEGSTAAATAGDGAGRVADDDPAGDANDRPADDAPSTEPARAADGAAVADIPIDIRDAERAARFEWKKPRRAPSQRKAAYLSAIVLLVVGVAVQAVLEFRDALAAHVPAARPILAAACRVLSCAIEPLRDAGALSMDASDLQADPAHRGLLVLSATIRNRSSHPIAYPYLELTLTDTSDRVVVRRAFAPVDYAGGTADLLQGLPANGERLVKLFIDATATQQAGYRVYLFYP